MRRMNMGTSMYTFSQAVIHRKDMIQGQSKLVMFFFFNIGYLTKTKWSEYLSTYHLIGMEDQMDSCLFKKH